MFQQVKINTTGLILNLQVINMLKICLKRKGLGYQLDRVKLIWYLLPMRAAKVQASLRIHAVSPESPLLAHTSSESRGTFRQKAAQIPGPSEWLGMRS